MDQYSSFVRKSSSQDELPSTSSSALAAALARPGAGGAGVSQQRNSHSDLHFASPAYLPIPPSSSTFSYVPTANNVSSSSSVGPIRTMSSLRAHRSKLYSRPSNLISNVRDDSFTNSSRYLNLNFKPSFTRKPLVLETRKVVDETSVSELTPTAQKIETILQKIAVPTVNKRKIAMESIKSIRPDLKRKESSTGPPTIRALSDLSPQNNIAPPLKLPRLNHSRDNEKSASASSDDSQHTQQSVHSDSVDGGGEFEFCEAWGFDQIISGVRQTVDTVDSERNSMVHGNNHGSIDTIESTMDEGTEKEHDSKDLSKGESKEEKKETTFGFGIIKTSDALGSWECPTCMVSNKSNCNNCVCCGEQNPKGEVEKADVPDQNPEKSSNLEQALGSFDASNTNIKGSPDWECPSCMVFNKPNSSKCVCCDEPNPSKPTSSKTSAALEKTDTKESVDSTNSKVPQATFTFGFKPQESKPFVSNPILSKSTDLDEKKLQEPPGVKVSPQAFTFGFKPPVIKPPPTVIVELCKPTEETWKCGICSDDNNLMTQATCKICNTANPHNPSNQVQETPKPNFAFTFKPFFGLKNKESPAPVAPAKESTPSPAPAPTVSLPTAPTSTIVPAPSTFFTPPTKPISSPAESISRKRSSPTDDDETDHNAKSSKITFGKNPDDKSAEPTGTKVQQAPAFTFGLKPQDKPQQTITAEPKSNLQSILSGNSSLMTQPTLKIDANAKPFSGFGPATSQPQSVLPPTGTGGTFGSSSAGITGNAIPGGFKPLATPISLPTPSIFGQPQPSTSTTQTSSLFGSGTPAPATPAPTQGFSLTPNINWASPQSNPPQFGQQPIFGQSQAQAQSPSGVFTFGAQPQTLTPNFAASVPSSTTFGQLQPQQVQPQVPQQQATLFNLGSQPAGEQRKFKKAVRRFR